MTDDPVLHPGRSRVRWPLRPKVLPAHRLRNADRRWRRWWWLLVVLAGFAAPAVALAPPASAHATVASSDPQDGARLSAAPAQVSITFDEPVGLVLGYLTVVDAQGRTVSSGSAGHPAGDGARIAVALQPNLGDGTYIVSWRVISADSHPVGGALRFVVGNGLLSTVSVAQRPVVVSSTAAVFDAARSLTYLALALLGGSWLLLTVWPQGRRSTAARRTLVAGWALAVVGAIAETVLQGPYAAGVGPGGVLRIDLVADTLGTSYGRLHLLRILLLAVLGALLDVLLSAGAGRPSGRRSVPGVLIFLAVVFTVSGSGHAAVARPVWLALTSDMLHLTAMSVWVGGLTLLLLAVLPAADPAQLAGVLPTFSRVAMCCVAVIAVTGTYQAWRETGTVVALTSTSYGLLVLAKVLLFAGLLALGNVSRLALQRRYGGLRRSVLAEVVVAAVVLGVSGVLVAQPPGRTAAASAAASTPVAARLSAMATAMLGAGRTVTISVTPAHSGSVTVALVLRGGPTPQRLTLTAALPDRRLGPLPVPLQPAGRSAYSAAGILLPAAGRWTFTLVVQTSAFDAVTTTLRVLLD